MPVVISRAEAKAQGLKQYFDGRPCPRGHMAERRTSSAYCVTCKNLDSERYRRTKGIPPAKPKAMSDGERKALWHRENRDKEVARLKAWRAANKGKARQYEANRRARLAQAEGHHTATEIAALYQRQRGRCANCKASLKPGYHADHIVPLARGGSNWISNIQLLCPPCNLSKKAKDPIAFALEQGRLV